MHAQINSAKLTQMYVFAAYMCVLYLCFILSLPSDVSSCDYLARKKNFLSGLIVYKSTLNMRFQESDDVAVVSRSVIRGLWTFHVL